MSSPLAIAGVTAVLKNLLHNGVVQNEISTTVGNVKVSCLAPDRVLDSGSSSSAENLLNLFLYHVTPNPGWRNGSLPSRDNGGDRLTNPPLALDLHYMLTAYGAEDFQAEILLGYAMQVLHENPVLTRAAIRAALPPANAAVSATGPLPAAYAVLSAADLADQVELIKIAPQTLSTDELSKLWTAFQTHYRPTVAYHLSVVLIDSHRPTRSGLPVRSRTIRVQPDAVPPFPRLVQATPPSSPWAITMGQTLAVGGNDLGGDVIACFRHVPSGRALQIPGVSTSETTAEVTLPAALPVAGMAEDSPAHPDNWEIGMYALSLLVTASDGVTRASNELPLALAPEFGSTPALALEGDTTVLTISVTPKVWSSQQMRLIVGETEIGTDPLPAPKMAELTFRAVSAALPHGRQHVRLRIDGVESLLIDAGAVTIGSDPPYRPSQSVVLP
jgi:hypothetical protein